MRTGFRQLAFLIAPPLMSVALLAGIVAEQQTHLTPKDVGPYHDRAKAAVDGIPYVIGTWTGKDNQVPLAAQKLLRPNAILSRTYLDNSTNGAYQPAVASLLIVQCRDSRDMVGHYPPICYRAQGMMLDEKMSRDRDWLIGGMKIPGHEYQFTEVWQGQTNHTTVYNFLIVPGRGIVRDMKGVEEAAEDYQQRYYGAAQFQVVFHGLASADRSRDERDEMFAALIGPNLKVIETLTSGALEMSRDIQIFNQSNLPAIPDEMLGGGLGAPAASAPAQSPLKKLHRLLRGREKWAIGLGIVLALCGAAAGWMSQKPQWQSSGLLWIKPNIPSLAISDKVMPFYNYYVATQATILTSPAVLHKAVASPEWRATGLPSDSTSEVYIKTGLDVVYAKNSQHVAVDFIDDRGDVAQAAVKAVVKSYNSIYSDANGQEMQGKLTLLTNRRDELDNAIKGIQIHIHALTDRHGSDDLKVIFDKANEHLINTKDQMTKNDMTLESAKASIGPKDGQTVDPTKGLSLEQIAAVDVTMREYLKMRDAMAFNLARLARTVGTLSRPYTEQKGDLDLQNQRIEQYAAEYRAHFFGGTVFNFDTMQQIPLTKEMFTQIEVRSTKLHEQYDHEAADFKILAEDWSQILDLKSQVERNRNELEKIQRSYDELSATVAMGGTLIVVNDGDTPVPAPDKRKQFAFVGFVGGGCLPLGVLLLIGLMDGKMRYSEEAGADMSGMTLLGILPNLPDRLTDPAQAATAAHCVHQIRTMLQINAGEDSNVFAVTSASPGDGKTSLTLALGLSFAASGSRTLLIDCDLVGAGLTSRLDMGGPNGVLEAMANRDLLQFCRPTDIADLSMLPVGQAQAHHAGMFSPQALRRLIGEAKKHFEIILIDSGPVLGSIEATPVCSAADGVILTVSRGQQRPLVEKAIQHLVSIGARFAGVVFNRAQARDFARSISGISLRSIARQHQPSNQNGPTNGNGHSGPRQSGAFGPVARAVASSVKPHESDAA